MNSDDPTIALMGVDIPASHDLFDIHELLFLSDNPRVYAAIRDKADFASLAAPDQQIFIYKQLLQEPSVKKLIPEIRRDGGLQNPVIVRRDTQQVIEGNSRLAAYRRLHDKFPDEEQWIKIKCLVVDKLTDDQQTRLLAQAHLHGQTEWSPYAKALYCFSWVEEKGQDVSNLSKISGISAAEIKKSVEIIQLMKDNDDGKTSRFSYYDVTLRNRSIKSAIERDESLKDTLLADIKKEVFTAQEMRDKLPRVIEKPKLLSKYKRGHSTLEDAFDRAKVSDTQKRLKRIRDHLREVERTDIASLQPGEIGPVKQIVRHIEQELKRVSGIVTELAPNKR